VFTAGVWSWGVLLWKTEDENSL